MTTATRTREDVLAEADGIITGVREARWPGTREAQWAIGWAFAEAGDIRRLYADLLAGDLDPFALPAEDKGWWDAGDPLPQALEWAADQFLQAAREAARRLSRYQQDEASSKGGAR